MISAPLVIPFHQIIERYYGTKYFILVTWITCLLLVRSSMFTIILVLTDFHTFGNALSQNHWEMLWDKIFYTCHLNRSGLYCTCNNSSYCHNDNYHPRDNSLYMHEYISSFLLLWSKELKGCSNKPWQKCNHIVS